MPEKSRETLQINPLEDCFCGLSWVSKDFGEFLKARKYSRKAKEF